MLHPIKDCHPEYTRNSKLNSTKPNNLNKKMDRDLKNTTKIHRWQISIGKDAPHRVIREMQIKVTMRYHYTPIRTAELGNIDWHTKHWQHVRPQWPWSSAGGNGKWCSRSGMQLGGFLQNQTTLSYQAIQQLGFLAFNQRMWKQGHIKTCTQVFTEALFIIAQTWKQPRCPSEGEWINQPWYIQTVGYYTTLKRNELSNHKKTEGP